MNWGLFGKYVIVLLTFCQVAVSWNPENLKNRKDQAFELVKTYETGKQNIDRKTSNGFHISLFRHRTRSEKSQKMLECHGQAKKCKAC